LKPNKKEFLRGLFKDFLDIPEVKELKEEIESSSKFEKWLSKVVVSEFSELPMILALLIQLAHDAETNEFFSVLLRVKLDAICV
jgi:hypothetical protein